MPGGAPVRRCRLASPFCTYKQRQQAPMQNCCMFCSPVSAPRIKQYMEACIVACKPWAAARRI